jgi:hypothetical protein
MKTHIILFTSKNVDGLNVQVYFNYIIHKAQKEL